MVSRGRGLGTSEGSLLFSLPRLTCPQREIQLSHRLRAADRDLSHATRKLVKSSPRWLKGLQTSDDAGDDNG